MSVVIAMQSFGGATDQPQLRDSARQFFDAKVAVPARTVQMRRAHMFDCSDTELRTLLEFHVRTRF